MKKLILICAIVLVSITCFAEKRAEVTVIQSGIKLPVKTYFDNGKGKVEEVKTVYNQKFPSAVAVINYYKALGWTVKEMHVNTISFGNIIRIYVITKKEE